MDKLILTYDGDGCGKKVGRAIIANDEKALGEISAKIDLGHEIVNHWIAEHKGKRISGGGDEGTFYIPSDAVKEIEHLRKDYEFATGITISVGIGKDLSEAGRALLAAKFRGKNQTAHYDDSVEKDIDKARKRVKKGNATQEEYKLAEAYLEKAENMAQLTLDDCQYCDQTDGVDPDHCKYCHDVDSQAGEAHCQYCADADAKANIHSGDGCLYCAAIVDHDHSGDDCKYCADAAPADTVPESKVNGSTGMGPTISLPTTTSASNYAGQDLSSPEIDKPDSTTAASQRMGQSMAPPGVTSETLLPQEDNTHTKEAMMAIAREIEGATPGQTEANVMNHIDESDIAIGQNTEGGASRPVGFEQNVPGDMGLPQDPAPQEDPDLTDVLREGLDNHANTMQRDRVIQMASQALQGFKGCKDVLERAKEQAPQLYQSSIAMLKAMIEMAKLLGLGENEMEGDPSVVPENEWHEPFPKHPDHGGEQKPGHAAPGGAAGTPQQ